MPEFKQDVEEKREDDEKEEAGAADKQLNRDQQPDEKQIERKIAVGYHLYLILIDSFFAVMHCLMAGDEICPITQCSRL